MSYNRMPAAGDPTRGPQNLQNPTKALTTMKDFVILTKIGMLINLTLLIWTWVSMAVLCQNQSCQKSLHFKWTNFYLSLGDGAYSEVYKVKRNSDHQVYALKKVSSLNKKHFSSSNWLTKIHFIFPGQNGQTERQRKRKRLEWSSNSRLFPVSSSVYKRHLTILFLDLYAWYSECNCLPFQFCQ